MKVPERWWLAGRLRGVAAGVLVALALPAAALSGAPRHEVCTDQIHAYMREHFAQTVTRIDYRLDNDADLPTGDDGSTNEAIVYVAECPGYHWFEVLTNEYGCRFQAHYGTVPNYLMYRGAEQGC